MFNYMTCTCKLVHFFFLSAPFTIRSSFLLSVYVRGWSLRRTNGLPAVDRLAKPTGGGRDSL